MNISGKIVEVLPLQSGMGRNGEWKKQAYIVEYNSNSQFPKKMMFSIWGDKISQFNIQKDQMVSIDFDIDCREFNGRWYNDITAWRVSQSDGKSPLPQDDEPFPPLSDPAPSDGEIDMPF